MSLLIDQHAVSVAAGCASLVLTTLGLTAWRFALECERGWLRCEALPLEPFEEELFAQMRAELARNSMRASAEHRPAEESRGQLALAS
jgi:hypothetical protein